jgi:hypothetical protein
VIREIEIWRVAVLMVNRYADEAEANSFMRAAELVAEGELRIMDGWHRDGENIQQAPITTTASKPS